MRARLAQNAQYQHGPEELAGLLCTVPDGLIPRNERDFLQRSRKVLRITRPDRHQDASTAIQVAMNDLTRSINYGRDALSAYLDRMRRGETRAPLAAQGSYYQDGLMSSPHSCSRRSTK